MALQGHSRSILALIESGYATSYWSSTVTLVLSCLVSEILQFSAKNSDSTPIPPEFWGCSPWTRLPMLGLRRAKLQANYSLITFEVTEPIWPQIINVADGQTHSRTDNMWWQYRSMRICASRSKNWVKANVGSRFRGCQFSALQFHTKRTTDRKK